MDPESARESLFLVGREGIFRGLSDSGLNGRAMRVVKIDSVRNRVVVDATPPSADALAVRYVSAPFAKMVKCGLHNFATDDLAAWAVMGCANRDDAFAAAGLDPRTVVSLRVQPFPDIRHKHCFQDVPVLASKLGQGYKIVFGYSLFGQSAFHGKKFQSFITSEPTLVLQRISDGVFIDPSPDLVGDFRHKLFIPDPELTRIDFTRVMNFVMGMCNSGNLPRLNIEEDHRGELDSLVPVPPTPHGNSVLVQPFCDMKLASWPGASHVELMHAYGSAMRENAERSILISRSLVMAMLKTMATTQPDWMRVIPGSPYWEHHVCSHCLVRTDVVLICSGCGKARYCSRGCQLAHAKEHKGACSAFQKRKARQAADEKKAAMRRAHDAREAQEAAERKEKELARREAIGRARQQAAEERERELAAVGTAKPGPSHRAPKAREAKTRDTETALTHEAYVSPEERAARREHGERTKAEKQARAAAEREAARQAAEKAERDRPTARDVIAHLPPPLPTIAEQAEAALAAPRASALGLTGSAGDDDALSTITKATDEVSLHPTRHFDERRAERGITTYELQHSLKHGEHRPGNVPGTFEISDGNVAVVRGKDKTDITTYRP